MNIPTIYLLDNFSLKTRIERMETKTHWQENKAVTILAFMPAYFALMKLIMMQPYYTTARKTLNRRPRMFAELRVVLPESSYLKRFDCCTVHRVPVSFLDLHI